MAEIPLLYQAVSTEPGSCEMFLPNSDLREICTFSGKVSAWFHFSPHNCLGVTGEFFPCQLVLMRKQGKAAEWLGLGEPLQQESDSRSAVITLRKGSVSVLCSCGNQGQQSCKPQKAEPVKQGGVSSTSCPPGTGSSLIRGKVSIQKSSVTQRKPGETVNG